MRKKLKIIIATCAVIMTVSCMNVFAGTWDFSSSGITLTSGQGKLFVIRSKTTNTKKVSGSLKSNGSEIDSIVVNVIRNSDGTRLKQITLTEGQSSSGTYTGTANTGTELKLQYYSNHFNLTSYKVYGSVNYY